MTGVFEVKILYTISLSMAAREQQRYVEERALSLSRTTALS
jgi:hypothetical protein